MVILSNTTIIPARQCSTKQTASKLATSGSSSAAVGEMVARTTAEPTSPHGPPKSDASDASKRHSSKLLFLSYLVSSTRI